MPRDGSGVYTRPPGTDAVPDTTIESTKYNGFVGDVETDLNAPRPIIAGGSGASNTYQARTNLQAERSEQQITNYDAHPWESGSCWSAAGATGAPNATDGFTGHVTRVADGTGAQDKWTVVVRSRQTGTSYVRQKVGSGAWSVWTTEASDKVAKIGDSMSGDLHIIKSVPGIYLDANDVNGAAIVATRAGLGRWALYPNDGTAEGGVSDGADFRLRRFDNTGAFIDDPLVVFRGNGDLTLAHNVNMTSSSPRLNFQRSAGVYGGIHFRTAGSDRWFFGINGDAESGGNNGSNIQFLRYNDAGAFMDAPFTMLRASGLITVAGDPTTALGVVTKQYADNKFLQKSGDSIVSADPTLSFVKAADANVAQTYIYTGASVRWLFRWADANTNDWDVHRYDAAGTYVGTPLTISWATGETTLKSLRVTETAYLGGLYVLSGNARSRAGAGANAYYVLEDENATTRGYINWERTDDSVRFTQAASGTSIILGGDGRVNLAKGFVTRAGLDGAYGGNAINFNWTGQLTCYVDNSPLQIFPPVSDYRLKKDVADLPSTWDKVKALRPITYTNAEFTLPVEQASRAKREPLPPTFTADNVERWGFLAHELQEALLPSAASSRKDDPGEIQCVNMATVVAVLTKALQEAMTRIEELEAVVQPR